MIISRQTVNRITDKHISSIYNGKRLIINEKNSPFQIRVGKNGNKYYFHGMIKGKSVTRMIGDCKDINLYRALEIVDEIKGSNLRRQLTNQNTLLNIIYGEPSLYSIKNTAELIERLPHGCFLFAKKDRSRFSNIRSDMNALLNFYMDKDGTCSANISKLDSTELVELGEKLHHELGRSTGGAIKTFNQWKSFFKWLKQRKILNDNLLDDTELDLTIIPTEKTDRTFCNREISTILKSFPNDIKAPFGYLAPLGLLLCRRNATLSKIKKSYIDWDNSLINSNREIEKKGKVAKNLKKVHLEVMMSDYAKELIRDLCNLFPDSEWLFPNPDNPQKHIDVGVNGNTNQLLFKPREIFKSVGEIVPFSNSRLRTTYITNLSKITNNDTLIEFISGLTSNMSIKNKHYNEGNYRKEKLTLLNNLAEVYKGNGAEITADIVDFPTKIQRNKLFDKSSPKIENARKLGRLKNRKGQLDILNEYRIINGKTEKNYLNTDLYNEGYKFFNFVMDFEIYKKRSDLLEAQKILTEDLRDFILSYDYYIKNNNLKPYVNLTGEKYLTIFDEINNEYKSKITEKFNKQSPELLREISDVLFLKDLRDNFDKYENVIVVKLGKATDINDAFGVQSFPEKALPFKNLIHDTYNKINIRFKHSQGGNGEELRKQYRLYLTENRKEAKLTPLWLGFKFLSLEINHDVEPPEHTYVCNENIPEHYFTRKIENIVFASIVGDTR